MELNKVLSMVRGLTAKAEHESTPAAEAQACRERADALMLQYAIDQADIRKATPLIDRGKPESALFPTAQTTGADGDLVSYVEWLLESVAAHTRCLVRPYAEYSNDEKCWMSRVYGWESDLRYFEILYTTLRLHMLGVLRPKADPALSDDENAYRLHNAGYNWLEIAGMYGWRKLSHYSVYENHAEGLISDELFERWAAEKAEIWHNAKTEETKTNWQIGSYFKRAAQREGKRQGDDHHRVIAAGATGTYRRSALQGYVTRIGQRLRATQKARAAGAGELVLASAAEDLRDFFREASPASYTRCPACGKLSANAYDCDRCGHHIADAPEQPECERCKKAESGYCRAHRPRNYKPLPFSREAYSTGVRHADTADITGTDRMAGTDRREIG